MLNNRSLIPMASAEPFASASAVSSLRGLFPPLPTEADYTADSQMSTMAPFPTGPLAVFGRDLAAALFEDCTYLKQYESSARHWGRRTLCKATHPQWHLSFASTLCDTVLAHWVAKCGVDVTIAHTTRTKSHHYMWRGAGLGWMPPSNISLAVHGLKAKRMRLHATARARHFVLPQAHAGP